MGNNILLYELTNTTLVQTGYLSSSQNRTEGEKEENRPEIEPCHLPPGKGRTKREIKENKGKV